MLHLGGGRLDTLVPVGAAEGCDLLTLFWRSKDRRLRQLLQGFDLQISANEFNGHGL